MTRDPMLTEKKWREEIGQRIRKARRAADLTQLQLARKIGVTSAGFICEVEKGKRALCAFNLFTLEKHLGPLWLRGDA